ncbi:hypothetical protein RIF29_22161 [Crotalaria pallida]|uniref:pectinesterase n=1 Tax=Crotalaria pallida TaxID=3830 RepID=A0AAN9F6N4_CROPI
MEHLISQAITLPLVLFVICSFWVCRASRDCGGNKIAHTIIVDQSGQGDFTAIQTAIDSIEQNNNRWVKIHIKAGTYIEKVLIPYDKPCIYLEGEGRQETIITYNDHQQTDVSATFSSRPNNVVAESITFMNSYNVANLLNLQQRKIGDLTQAVVPALAARIYGNKCAFYDCSFIGCQDTLWDSCILNATSSGFVTAQGRKSSNSKSGFVFKGGSVVGNGETFLGRPYRPFSRVVFYGTYFSSVVAPQGWDAWQNSKQQASPTYIEADCTGEGADTSKRVLWAQKLDGFQMDHYSRSSFIDYDDFLAYLPVTWLTVALSAYMPNTTTIHNNRLECTLLPHPPLTTT